MKVTRLLPRPLAIAYQENDLKRVDGRLEYFRSMVRLYERLSREGHDELGRLRGRVP